MTYLEKEIAPFYYNTLYDYHSDVECLRLIGGAHNFKLVKSIYKYKTGAAYLISIDYLLLAIIYSQKFLKRTGVKFIWSLKNMWENSFGKRRYNYQKNVIL